jgi:hypothetical protein
MALTSACPNSGSIAFCVSFSKAILRSQSNMCSDSSVSCSMSLVLASLKATSFSAPWIHWSRSPLLTGTRPTLLLDSFHFKLSFDRILLSGVIVVLECTLLVLIFDKHRVETSDLGVNRCHGFLQLVYLHYHGSDRGDSRRKMHTFRISDIALDPLLLLRQDGVPGLHFSNFIGLGSQFALQFNPLRLCCNPLTLK